jgi:hypothetical protein
MYTNLRSSIYEVISYLSVVVFKAEEDGGIFETAKMTQSKIFEAL